MLIVVIMLSPLCHTIIGCNPLMLVLDVQHVSHVVVMWFIFHVLQLLPIRFTQQNLSCINNSTMTRHQKSDLKADIPLLSYGYRKCMLVDSFTRNRFSQMCSLWSIEWLIKIEDKVQSLSNMCLYGVCSLILI